MKKTISLILCVVLVLGMLTVIPFGAYAAEDTSNEVGTLKTQAEAVAWAQSQIGEQLEYYNDQYPYQCVELICFYYKFLGYTSPGGDARDYRTNQLPSSTWDRFEYSSGTIPKSGDIVIWSTTPYINEYGNWDTNWFGHIGIVESANSSGMTVIDQNGAGGAFKVARYTYSYSYGSLWGFIRPDFNPYVDLGDGFYALITHKESWNHLTNETDGNVDICWENYSANQYWKFFRQSDGSYIIKNAATGKCLEVSGGSNQNGANIQVYDQNNTNAQKWEIIPCGNGYQLKAKCTDCVMEMNAWSFYQGVNLACGTKDGSSAEIFAINKKDFSDVGKTNLNVKCEVGKAVFEWGNALCSTAYNIQIWRGTSTSGNRAYSLWNRKSPCTYELEEGTYTAYLECFNALGDYVNSSPVTFKVVNYDALIPAASIENNGHTYVFYNHTYTWYEAYLACEKLGGHLVTITSKEENDKVVELVNGACSTVWTGATKLSSSNWYWVNSEPYTENDFWASGEPSNTGGNELFINLYTSGTEPGKWNDIIGNTANVKGFVCEYDDDINADDYQPIQIAEYNGFTYELYDYSVDWQTAKKICEKKGGRLVDIADAEEQEYIWNMTKRGAKAEYWLGLTDVENEGVWKWVSGSEFSYNNWKAGTPDNDLGIESYGLIKKENGAWNDLKGYAYAYHSIGFICEYEPEEDITIGDINGDTAIDVLDALMIHKYAVDKIELSDEEKYLADVNNDNVVDILDALDIQKFAVDKLTGFTKKA